MGGIIIPIKNWKDLASYMHHHGGNFFIEVAPSKCKYRYRVTWLDDCLISYDISNRMAKKLIKCGAKSTGIVDHESKIPQACLGIQREKRRMSVETFSDKLGELFCPECNYNGRDIKETINALFEKMYGGDNDGE